MVSAAGGEVNSHPRVLGNALTAVAAAARLGMVLTDRWPMIAAHLVAAGADGEHLVQLAGLPRDASGWQIDTLLPDAMAEARAPQLSEEQASEIIARVLCAHLGDTGRHVDHPLVRALAVLAPQLDYPSGVIYQAYQAAEWLDCDCHRDSPERDDTDRLEDRLHRLPTVDLAPAFVEALLAGTPPGARSGLGHRQDRGSPDVTR